MRSLKLCSFALAATLMASAASAQWEFRLVDGGSDYGRLEVRPDAVSTWGTVCDDAFDFADAAVACRSLGLTDTLVGFRPVSSSDTCEHGAGFTYMDDLACGGGEATLDVCTFTDKDSEDCDHTEDIVVYCGTLAPPPALDCTTATTTTTTTTTAAPTTTTAAPTTTTAAPTTTTAAPTTTTAAPTTTTTTTAAPTPPPTTTTTTAAPTPAPTCTCPQSLTVNYDSDAIADAASDGIAAISLDETDWIVTFTVSNIRSITNGHVLPAHVDARLSTQDAFTPIVNYNAADLWGAECYLSGNDQPLPALGVTASYNEADCLRSYSLQYSLIDPAQRSPGCELNERDGDIIVNCSLTITSTRSVDGILPQIFQSQEAAFAAEIAMPETITQSVASALQATLARCTVKNAPSFSVDCRVPGTHTVSSVAAEQAPLEWIVPGSCASAVEGSNTYISCDLNSSVPLASGSQATATLAATMGNGDVMRFDVEYNVPTKFEVVTSASLADFVTGVSLAEDKYFYAMKDVATVHVDVVDTARLAITDITFSNGADPVKEYDLQATPAFDLSTSVEATRFVLEFMPGNLKTDYGFYIVGPHSINISMTFNAASRRQQQSGWVSVSRMNVQGPDESSSESGSATASGAAFGTLAAIVASALVVSGIIVGGAFFVRRRRAAPVPSGVQMDAVAPQGDLDAAKV